jgi:hypothetical protein
MEYSTAEKEAASAAMEPEGKEVGDEESKLEGDEADKGFSGGGDAAACGQ